MTMKMINKSFSCVAFFSMLIVTPATADVTWMELLEPPDDVALNTQFISERVKAGDLGIIRRLQSSASRYSTTLIAC